MRAMLFHRTKLPESKPVPLTVSVNGVPVTDTEVGDRLEMAGIAATLNGNEPDVCPSGLITLIVAVPGLDTNAAGTDALSVVELRLVVSGVPFHWTTDPDTRLVPRTLRVKALLPAEILDGVSREMDGGASGAGAVTVNVD